MKDKISRGIELEEVTPFDTPVPIDIRRGGTSASNAQADSLCPGRHLAQRGIPEPVSSEDASFGRIVHAALAKSSDEGLTVEQQDIYESCRSIEQKLVNQCFGPDAARCKVFREQRFWVKVKGDPKGTVIYEHSGQPDVIYRLNERALIIEYKALPGDKQVSAENEQLRDQVVLAAGHLILSEVMAAVIQPMVTHDPVPVLYDKTSIKQAEEDLFNRVRKSNDPKSPRIPGEEQCKFCLARTTCEPHAKWQASLLPATVSIPDSPIAVWTPEQMALFCSRKAAIQKWMDECEQAIKDALKANPDAVPGYCLKPGATRQTITDPQELFNRFAGMGGTLEQFMGSVSINKGNLEAAVRSATNTKGKALNAKVESLLEGITETKQNQPSIAKKKG